MAEATGRGACGSLGSSTPEGACRGAERGAESLHPARGRATIDPSDMHDRDRGERMGADRDACSAAPSRRTVLTLALGLTLGLPLLDVAAAQDADPKAARPREGDRLVFASGSRKGRVIAPADAPPGEPPLTAYPMDPVTSVVRDGSRLNQVLLARLEPEELGEET